MLQVHCFWTWFIFFTLYMIRAFFSPREGYSPGEAAVQRRKRLPNTEIRMTVTQVVMNA